jgi:predicted nucleic acid-binding protein
MKKLIVLDANILIRAILGERVPSLLKKYDERVSFFTPASCYDQVRHHLPIILQKRNLPSECFICAIEILTKIVKPLNPKTYCDYEYEAKQRIQERDPFDWEIVALSLALNCPIWTEDNDFFGIGIVIWNTRNVEIYLSS